MHFLGLLGSRVPASADRPDRFVGQRGACKRGHPGDRGDRAQLPLHHVLGFTALALLQRFPHAQNRREPGALRGSEPRCNANVILAVKTAPLRVTDDRVTAAEFPEHRAGHFTRVRAGVVIGDVLRAPGDGTARERRRHLREVGKRGANDYCRTAHRLQPGPERIEQARVRVEAAVHLPVAYDKPRAHRVETPPKLAILPPGRCEGQTKTPENSGSCCGPLLRCLLHDARNLLG